MLPSAFGSGEKIVPMKDVFKNRVEDIEVFREDKDKVYELLKYILNSDCKVMKAQADTIQIKYCVERDAVKIRGKNASILKENHVKLMGFSKALNGENSEERRIRRAWKDLIDEAQITDTRQVLQDFGNLMTLQWPCIIVGCYLSKYLAVPRAPLKVFELLMLSCFYTTGKIFRGILGF